MCGDQWPTVLYSGTYDPMDPWNGLLRSNILVRVSDLVTIHLSFIRPLSQAYKHIFTSPSSVDAEPKATRSGNAHIHGMVCAMRGSIAYIAIQVSLNTTEWHFLTDFSRSDSHFHHHQSFHVQIKFVTLNAFTIACLSCFTMQRNRKRLKNS